MMPPLLKKCKRLFLLCLTTLLSGCISTAIGAAGATVGAGVKVTGAAVSTTAKVGGAVAGATIDAVIPGDSKKDDEE